MDYLHDFRKKFNDDICSIMVVTITRTTIQLILGNKMIRFLLVITSYGEYKSVEVEKEKNSIKNKITQVDIKNTKTN